MKTFRILTLGCKVNQYESEALAQLFLEHGYRVASQGEAASVSVINTCSVTNMSDRKSRKMIRQCVKDGGMVVVCGCYAQANPEEIAQIDGVDLILGNGNKHTILSMIEELEANKDLEKITIFPLDAETSFPKSGVQHYREKSRAIIKIQDGCNSFCSYCIIPYVRGRLRSRNAGDIVEEVKTLAKNGYLEIVLAGIHVCHYGVDFPKDSPIKDLVDLLMELEKIPQIQRIRLSSIEPLAFSEKFFEFYETSQKLCPHFHISLQSGSDTVLKRMNRHYTGDYFLKTVQRLYAIRPETAITTDVIVGFPGETEDEFQETLDLIEKVKFLKVHTFPYSPRSGTVAADLPDQIPPNIKDLRCQTVLTLSEDLEQEFLKKYLGKPLSVLPEQQKENGYYGLSQNYLPILIETEEALENKIYEVIPYRTDGIQLYAKLSK